MTLNAAYSLMPDELVWVFQELLIYYGFPAQPSLGFIGNGQRKDPVSVRSVSGNPLGMKEVGGEWPGWFKQTGRQQ